MKANITYPRQASIAGRHLFRFLLAEKLKHRDADESHGSYRLSGYVDHLQQKHGWTFERLVGKDDFYDSIGRIAIYTGYWLPYCLIQRAGAEGQEYARKVLGWETQKIAERVAATTPNAALYPKQTALGNITQDRSLRKNG